MSARVPTLTEQDYFRPDIMILVDKPITGSEDWLQARALYLKYIGNSYIQGSTNGINWHDEITTSDIYYRLTTDGGTTWIDLSTTNIIEDTNLYYTEGRVNANTNVAANTAARHSHTNKTIIDNIIDNGAGNTFLADDGTYHNLFNRAITTETSNYNIADSDDIILLDCSSNAVTATLPTAVDNEGKIYIIKCIDDTYTCTVDTTLSQTIDGNTSITLINYESITIVSNNENWYIL